LIASKEKVHLIVVSSHRNCSISHACSGIRNRAGFDSARLDGLFVRRLGASEQNPFIFEGTTPDGTPCQLKLEAPSDSEFIVSMEPGASITRISKMASLTRATRSFDSYFSEHYKLFIPSGSHDIVEYRRRHDGSEYQLVFQNSLDQNKWTACGKFVD
jgi:hypothetical protein